MKTTQFDGYRQRPTLGSVFAMTRRAAHRKRAFTLVEMLVVVVILGIVLAIAIPIYGASQKHSKLQACKANMIAIYQAEEAYRVRNRKYAPSPVTGNPASVTTEWGKVTEMTAGPLRCSVSDAAYTVTTPTATSVTILCPTAGAHAEQSLDANNDGDTNDPDDIQPAAGNITGKLQSTTRLAYINGVFTEVP